MEQKQKPRAPQTPKPELAPTPNAPEQGQAPGQSPKPQIWRSVLGWVGAMLFLIAFALLIAYVGSLFS